MRLWKIIKGELNDNSVQWPFCSPPTIKKEFKILKSKAVAHACHTYWHFGRLRQEDSKWATQWDLLKANKIKSKQNNKKLNTPHTYTTQVKLKSFKPNPCFLLINRRTWQYRKCSPTAGLQLNRAFPVYVVSSAVTPPPPAFRHVSLLEWRVGAIGPRQCV